MRTKMKTEFTAPSEKTIDKSRILWSADCDAKKVRAIWKAADLNTLRELCPQIETFRRAVCRPLELTELKLHALNIVCDTHGVEYLGKHARTGQHVYYLNTGDTYAPTLCFMGARMFVSGWGDLIERKTVKHCD